MWRIENVLNIFNCWNAVKKMAQNDRIFRFMERQTINILLIGFANAESGECICL